MNSITPIETCGLIIGSFKPYTKGHHFLVTKAAEENDQVFLTVSLKDRKRKGEHPVLWSKMFIIWIKYILNILPKNVTMATNENPITAMYNFLHDIDQDENRPPCIYNFYMDDKDRTRYCYTDEELKKKFPNLYAKNEIVIKTFERKSNVDVSATKMRKALQDKNLEAFKTMLPNQLENVAHEIFEVLLS